jgi:hypothetical protein
MADRYVVATYTPMRGETMADWLNRSYPGADFRLVQMTRVEAPDTVAGVYWMVVWERL